MTIRIENSKVICTIGADGRNIDFIDKLTGKNYCRQNVDAKVARIKYAGQCYEVSSVTYSAGLLTTEFKPLDVRVGIRVDVKEDYIIFTVEFLVGDAIEELVFIDIPLALEGTAEDPFAGCALALNLQTNVREMPGFNKRLRAICYKRFGCVGARVAIIGVPPGQLREVLKKAVEAAEELPHPTWGGPYALDMPAVRGSYLSASGISEANVDEWIKAANQLGFTQLEFPCFRHGDFHLDPACYPRGLESLKMMNKKIHAAGLMAGLHTYSHCIATDASYVTPVPDPRLQKSAEFKLERAVDEKESLIHITGAAESLADIVRFPGRRLKTIQIDEELIQYEGLLCGADYVFVNCRRGAWDTRPSRHAKDAKIWHLAEVFDVFAPDGDSSLLSEIARRTADIFNKADFDMIYLDALDGAWILGGPENAWHYGSKFVFELCRLLKKPALFEMATFHHHLWIARSRIGTWECPVRGYKRYVDDHVASNLLDRRMFMPGQLGWWGVSFGGSRSMFMDDMEYLCCKALATDTGFSLSSLTLKMLAENVYVRKMADMVQRYESLRKTGKLGRDLKAKLLTPKADFTLVQDSSGKIDFRPVQYIKHTVAGIHGGRNEWIIENCHQEQPLKIRIETLQSALPYNSKQNIVIAEFADRNDFREKEQAPDVVAHWQSSWPCGPVAAACACYQAVNNTDKREGAWARMGTIFNPPLNLEQKHGLGVWICGDGQGEILNFQLRSPKNVMDARDEHYVTIDFKGWRYFELIEHSSERYADYRWPYLLAEWPGGGVEIPDSKEDYELAVATANHSWRGRYHIYGISVNYCRIRSLDIWYNHLPPGKAVTCHIGPVKALSLMHPKQKNPTLTVGNQTIIFPVEMEPGSFLEFYAMNDCKLYSPSGEIREVTPQGGCPVLRRGSNHLKFNGKAVNNDINVRAKVTTIIKG